MHALVRVSLAQHGCRVTVIDSAPRVGDEASCANGGLFMNTGHGMLGWTLACASGYDAALAVAQSN
jgi:glycine/D-amino acid oxidase-like deaminating enzyme